MQNIFLYTYFSSTLVCTFHLIPRSHKNSLLSTLFISLFVHTIELITGTVKFIGKNVVSLQTLDHGTIFTLQKITGLLRIWQFFFIFRILFQICVDSTIWFAKSNKSFLNMKENVKCGKRSPISFLISMQWGWQDFD